eukprot:TRINITY_DN3925_c0_g1_i2.p1 TRINITY_DN3925_c0_g1~~TRINITY_DN3925_c0_g1_i2.p1  ORF type:complete len:260 (+),score=65.81 TRINITY_DN3925_c0_g1_i2:46-825(+)
MFSFASGSRGLLTLCKRMQSITIAHTPLNTYKKPLAPLACTFHTSFSHRNNKDRNTVDWRDLEQKVYSQPIDSVSATRDPRTYLPGIDHDEQLQEEEVNIDHEMPQLVAENPPEPPFNPHKPFDRPEKRSNFGRSIGTGKRKTSIARAVVSPGEGVFTVNGRPLALYFKTLEDRDTVLQPFVATESVARYDTHISVAGSGTRSQAHAVRMAIAHALQYQDQGLRSPLAKGGYYRRDIRQVERKKPGQAGARRKFQWVKR